MVGESIVLLCCSYEMIETYLFETTEMVSNSSLSRMVSAMYDAWP